MKKRIFMICMSLFMLAVSATAQTIQLPLSFSIVDPTELDEEHPRTPARRPIITLDDHSVTFAAFGSACTCEIVEVNGDEETVVYSQEVPAGTTNVAIPSALSGTFIIRFVFGYYMYWGEIEL